MSSKEVPDGGIDKVRDSPSNSVPGADKIMLALVTTSLPRVTKPAINASTLAPLVVVIRS